MIQRIHHVQITIPIANEDQARAYYCDLLGLAEIEKPDGLKANGGLWLQVGTQEVHLGIQNDIERNIMRTHIAYQVENLAALRQKLEAAGYVTKDNTPIPGYDRFETRDPFGNRVEFIQPLP